MDSYLMMIYVTMEQEAALKTFFLDRGWAFCKPDLSYTTDKIGPAAGTFANIVRDEDFLNNPHAKNQNDHTGKRKVPPTPLANTPQFKRSKIIVNQTMNMLNKAGDTKQESVKASKDRSLVKAVSPITVEDIDGNSKAIKVEVTNCDEEYDPNGSYHGNAGDDSAMHAEYDGDTDVEDGYSVAGATLGDSQVSSHLDGSINTDEDDPRATGSKQKLDMISTSNLSNDFGHEYYRSEQEFILKQGLNWTCGYKPAIKCTFCHKTFTSLSARKRHEKTVHGMEKKFQCEHCDEKFAYKWLMEAHAAKKHGIGKLFTCACGQTFNRQSNLTQHATICKEVQGPGNETVCKVCTKRFKCKKYLDVHMKFQHDITTQPSVCNICGESFTRPWSLTRHLKRTHAIVESSGKDTETGAPTNTPGKEADSDSDEDICNPNREVKPGSDKDNQNSKRTRSQRKSNSISFDVQNEKTSSSSGSDISKNQKEPMTNKETESDSDTDDVDINVKSETN